LHAVPVPADTKTIPDRHRSSFAVTAHSLLLSPTGLHPACHHLTTLPTLMRCTPVFVCWLRVDFVPLRVVLGALGSLRLLPILTVHSFSYLRHCRLERLRTLRDQLSTSLTQTYLARTHPYKRASMQGLSACLCPTVDPPLPPPLPPAAQPPSDLIRHCASNAAMGAHQAENWPSKHHMRAVERRPTSCEHLIQSACTTCM
jgi:hypothetical protein